MPLLLNASKVLFRNALSTKCIYAGFDPTAPSLHLGHLGLLLALTRTGEIDPIFLVRVPVKIDSFSEGYRLVKPLF